MHSAACVTMTSQKLVDQGGSFDDWLGGLLSEVVQWENSTLNVDFKVKTILRN